MVLPKRLLCRVDLRDLRIKMRPGIGQRSKTTYILERKATIHCSPSSRVARTYWSSGGNRSSSREELLIVKRFLKIFLVHSFQLGDGNNFRRNMA